MMINSAGKLYIFTQVNSDIFYGFNIFDFGNGQTSDNVLLGMFGTTSKIHGSTFIGLSSKLIKTSPIVNLNQWYFISFVLKDTTGYVYVNGSQAITGTLYVPNNITRISNYIGIKNNLTSAKSNAIYDELKIYKKHAKNKFRVQL